MPLLHKWPVGAAGGKFEKQNISNKLVRLVFVEMIRAGVSDQPNSNFIEKLWKYMTKAVQMFLN